MSDRVLGLIPARGGSKGLPRKNLCMLAGRPLIAHSIEAAHSSRMIDRVVVSTDDEGIAEVSERCGAEVPFLRPPQLAEDDTPDLPVFQHALEWFEKTEGWRPEVIVQLRPTSPLRRPDDIDLAVELLDERPDADSVRSVAEPYENPYKMWSVGSDGWLEPLVATELREPFNMPRQRLPDVYWQTGAIDATRWSTVMDLHSMTGQQIAPLIVDRLGTVDIDTQASLDLVEWMLSTGRVPWLRPSLPGSVRPRLLVLDFDGVLTDNRVWVNEAGDEVVAFDRGDGMGIRLLRESGIEVVVLSTEEHPVVTARCRKLRIPCRQGLADKRQALVEVARDHDVDLAEVAYVGNDVNDLDCLRAVGLPVAVQDAHPDVLQVARVVLSRPGGSGAVREICDLIRESGQ